MYGNERVYYQNRRDVSTNLGREFCSLPRALLVLGTASDNCPPLVESRRSVPVACAVNFIACRRPGARADETIRFWRTNMYNKSDYSIHCTGFRSGLRV